MWAQVEFTHIRGVKLRPTEQHPRGVLQGEIISYAVGRRVVDAIALKQNFHAGRDLAVMYRPRLVTVGEDLIRKGRQTYLESRAGQGARELFVAGQLCRYGALASSRCRGISALHSTRWRGYATLMMASRCYLS